VSAEIHVRVIPRASRSQIVGVRDGAILVRLAAPPVGGAANEELIATLSRLLDLPKRSITIVSGDRSRRKRVHIDGLSPDDVCRMLAVPPL
jgi:hypothetical protein